MPSLKEFCCALRLLFDGMNPGMVRRIAAANAMALAGGVLAGMAPLVLKQMIDTASGGGSAQAPHTTLTGLGIAGFGIAYLLCLSIGRLVTEIRPLLIGTVEQGLYAGLRLRYFKHLLDLPLSFHLARRSGALGHSLLQAVSGYQIILSSLANGVVPVMVESVTVALVLVSLGLPALTASFAMTAVALSIAISLRMARLRATARAVSQATIDAHSHLADSLINYEPIKCFGRRAQHRRSLRATLSRPGSVLDAPAADAHGHRCRGHCDLHPEPGHIPRHLRARGVPRDAHSGRLRAGQPLHAADDPSAGRCCAARCATCPKDSPSSVP